MKSLLGFFAIAILQGKMAVDKINEKFCAKNLPISDNK